MHELVANPKQSKSMPDAKNYHRWTMFVQLYDKPAETSKYIKCVTYDLHPTFDPQQVKVDDAPFLLSRLGWGMFTAGITIKFKEATGLGT